MAEVAKRPPKALRHVYASKEIGGVGCLWEVPSTCAQAMITRGEMFNISVLHFMVVTREPEFGRVCFRMDVKFGQVRWLRGTRTGTPECNSDVTHHASR